MNSDIRFRPAVRIELWRIAMGMTCAEFECISAIAFAARWAEYRRRTAS